jgi:uncharacterized protein (TIGR02231 family)
LIDFINSIKTPFFLIMKKNLLVFTILLSTLSLWANTELRVKSTIKDATVYLTGAKLTSVATVSLASGNTEVIFDNLPVGINPSSMQIRFRNGSNANLLSAKFRTRYVETASTDNRVLRSMRDSIIDFNDKFSTFNNEREILKGEENLIAQNQNRIGTGKDNSLSVNDLKELSLYYRTRLTEIKKRMHELVIEERKLREPFDELQKRYNELAQKKGKTSGEIVLAINSTTSQSLEIACIYIVGGARWTPQYDLRSEGTDKPLKLVYKAAITQNCGLDWSEIKLQVSTANPNISNERPILTPQYLDYQVIRAYANQNQQELAKKSKEQERDMSRSNTYNLAQAPRASGEVINNNDDFQDFGTPVSSDEAMEVAAIFDVALSQSIPSDGEEHIVRVQESDMKAIYEYHSVPKVDPAAFLLAKVTDYGQYHLLPGRASIFYQDTYVGQSMIDPRTVGDTLLLSLGRDEAITIKRTKPVDVKSEKKIIGDTKKEVIEYEITIKNNKRAPISIEILDQVPISRQKDIEIEVDEKKLSNAEYNATYGKLLWKVNIEGNSSKKIRFGYTLKYPKNQTIGIAYQ